MERFTRFQKYEEALENLENMLGFEKLPIKPLEVPGIYIDDTNKGDLIHSGEEGGSLYTEIEPGLFVKTVLHICDIDIKWLEKVQEGFPEKVRSFLKEDHSKEEKESFLNKEEICKELHKYHFTYCHTLQKFFREKTESRYYASYKWNGLFSYSLIDNNSLLYESTGQKLYPCRYCLKGLGVKIEAKDFDMKEILNLPLDLPKHGSKLECQHILNVYTKDWKNTSRRYKERQNYICEECKKDCSKNKKSLDCHHVNMRKYDNRFLNLRALCKECHQKEHSF